MAATTLSIKALSDHLSSGISSLPTKYNFPANLDEQVESFHLNDQVVDSTNPEYTIPIIDYSLLTSGDPQKRSKILHDLRKACQEWGFFMLVNHGVEESVLKGIIDATDGFFNLTEEEKKEFEGTKKVLEPISSGTSFSGTPANDKILFWRDFYRFIVHPQFNSPYKPAGFSEAAAVYTKKTREIATELLKAISETLDLESDAILKAANWERGFQLLAANYYPACPQPDRAIGLPAHTDSGLLNLLIQNNVGGLQIEHKGKWVNWIAKPNSFIVDLGEQMQVMTNDKYKSTLHRAVVNNQSKRISIVSGHAPASDIVVAPMQELFEREGESPHYKGVVYKDYLEIQKSVRSYLKSTLDSIRI